MNAIGRRLFVAAALATASGYLACGKAAEPGDTGTLAAPSNLTGEQMGSGIHLTWKDNSADEEEFELERAAAAAPATFTRIASVTFDTAQYHDQSVTSGTAYRYRVRATKGSTTSAYSNEIDATAPSGAGGGSGGGMGGGAGGGAGGGGGTSNDSLPDGGYSFQQHIVPIFNNSCGAGDNSCHSRIAYGPRPNTQCRGWLALENASIGSIDPNTQQSTGCPDKTLYERLVELDSWMCESVRHKYIVPNDFAGSQVYQVVDPAADPSRGGTCMASSTVPLGRMPKAPYALSSTDRNKLKVWIEQGAPNN